MELALNKAWLFDLKKKKMTCDFNRVGRSTLTECMVLDFNKAW